MPHPSGREVLLTIAIIAPLCFILSSLMGTGIRGFIEYLVMITLVLSVFYLIELIRKRRKTNRS